MKAAWLFTILFLACGTACSQSLRVLPVQVAGGQEVPAAIQFFCTEKYNRKDCQNDISTLRKTLAHYSLDTLGSWSFVLASTDEWDRTVNRLHLPPASPVFSALGANMTVISQAMLSGSVDQRAELLRTYQVPLNRILDFALSHELGHALCHELDEPRAAVYGEQLLSGQSPACRPEGRRNRNHTDAAMALVSPKRFQNAQPHSTSNSVASRKSMVSPPNAVH